jgi:hypothetical protein
LSSLNKASASAFIIARLPPGATPTALAAQRSSRHHATAHLGVLSAFKMSAQ